jgi:hypothetical protein
VFLAVLGVTVVGLVRIVAAIRRLEREGQEVRAFAELFQRYFESLDLEAYRRLIEPPIESRSCSVRPG